MLKGHKHSEETKKKLSLAHQGKKRPLWVRKLMSEAAKKRKITPLFRKARSDNAKINPNYGMKGKHHSQASKLKMSLNNGSKGKTDEESLSWKGDDVGYAGLHKWVSKKLGKPSKCEHCGKEDLVGKKIHWANKSGKYLRDVKDWIRLCVPCHSKYDSKSRSKVKRKK